MSYSSASIRSSFFLSILTILFIYLFIYLFLLDIRFSRSFIVCFFPAQN